MRTRFLTALGCLLVCTLNATAQCPGGVCYSPSYSYGYSGVITSTPTYARPVYYAPLEPVTTTRTAIGNPKVYGVIYPDGRKAWVYGLAYSDGRVYAADRSGKQPRLVSYR